MLTNLTRPLKQWWQRLHKDQATPKQKIVIEPRILSRSEHALSRKNISKYALRVLYRLHESGYQAFLVGGGVRDVLLGLHPKDFDVATNAHPERVSELFSNSRLIGRRFRLVHVHFGRHIVEVATFRANPFVDTFENIQNSHDTNRDRVRRGAQGMILRDNVYGSLEEDVFRRDFTVNALYYNIADFSVIDFVGGVNDLNNKIIRMIGNPLERFREDPLRMLRAIRFAAKLKFTIDSNSINAISELKHLLLQVPSARLFDEYLKLFLTGYGKDSYEMLLKHDLLSILFPRVNLIREKIQNFLDLALNNTDERILADKTVSPHFLLATFLWYPLLTETEKLKQDGLSSFEAFHEAMEIILHEQRQSFAIPRRLSQAIKEIWSLQNRLKKRSRHRAHQLFIHPRFRAAYDFLLLRAKVLEDREVVTLSEWWTNYIAADEETRISMANAIKNEGNRMKRRTGKVNPSSKMPLT